MYDNQVQQEFDDIVQEIENNVGMRVVIQMQGGAMLFLSGSIVTEYVKTHQQKTGLLLSIALENAASQTRQTKNC